MINVTDNGYNIYFACTPVSALIHQKEKTFMNFYIW